MTDIATRKEPFHVEWRDGFKIHLGQLDREHKHLFTLVRKLELETVDKTIQELLNYVVTHFTNEHKLMEEAGYPAFADHLKLHEAFSNELADFLASNEEWNDDRVQVLRKFLNKWLIGHIMVHDLRFGNWYREHQGDDAVDPNANDTPRPGWIDRLLSRI